MKYTIEYLKNNPVAISCPTLEIFGKVTRLLKISGRLMDRFWEIYKENTKVSYTFDTSRPTPYTKDDTSYGITFKDFEQIEGEDLLRFHGIINTYEIY